MQEKYYTVERSQQIVISLLKQHGIKRVIASPGTTNITLVASMQQDPWFEMYSSVDERSAAYMACGMAAETGEPVVLSCTGATASRNYVPGLTEAYYRKLPVLAITSTQSQDRVGHMIPQVIDRSAQLADMVVLSEHIASCNSGDDEWNAMIKANRAILALKHHGGGPVHIDLATAYVQDFSCQELPVARKISRYNAEQQLPALPEGRIAIWVGNHTPMGKELTDAIDLFCTQHGAVVFCDHSSNYHGQYKAAINITAGQMGYYPALFNTTLLIHIGEVTADYNLYGKVGAAQKVWRVSEDGELRDTFRKLTDVFEMSELFFFNHYAKQGKKVENPKQFLEECLQSEDHVTSLVPELPFSHIWIAQQTAKLLPKNSNAHFGILNSLRSWDFWQLDESINGFTNSGGFGIDGDMSSCIGSSLVSPNKLHFMFIGDLAFFYDLNSLGNRHVGKNIRILLVNNGRGTEFRNFCHPGSAFGDKADNYISAAGHYGAQSPQLIRHYAEDLGFEYMTASSKEEFQKIVTRFVEPRITDKPMLLEVFTDSQDESDAYKAMSFLADDAEQTLKKVARKLLPRKAIDAIRSIMK